MIRRVRKRRGGQGTPQARAPGSEGGFDMGKKKSFKVTDMHSAFRDGSKPFVRFGGAWLKEYGFNVGDRLKLLERKNMLILVKADSGA